MLTYSTMKRIIDFTGALLCLIVAAPLMIFVALVVRVTLGSPVLFRQKRPGLHEQLFTCLKFRSMTDARDSDGRPLSDDQRMTRCGTLLRRTSLDELPQLWNILKGDLSFVGPRPLFEIYLPYYTPEERRRHTVPPGLTGWAQIHGRNCLSFDERLSLDVWYVDHMSFSLDLRILLSTLIVAVTQAGYATDSASLDQLRRISAHTPARETTSVDRH
jgi:lipopolysaccharide/colanic/teichoic acid biosynthesis glycosyltransferase